MRLSGLAFCALLTCCLSAQSEYRFFQPGEQYLYLDESFTFPQQLHRTQFYGIRVDSLGCEELYASLSPSERDPRNCIRRLPSPFGYAVCQSADSTVFDFRELGRMVIHQRALPDSSWVALENDDRTVRATVVSVVQRQALGSTDSLKVIALVDASGDTLSRMVLSRQYGLVESPFLYDVAGNSPRLSLVGTTQEQLGLQLPTTSAYGSVTVGNTYHIESIKPQPNPGPNDFDRYDLHQQETHTVLSVDSIVDGITYFTTSGDFLRFVARTDGSEPSRDSVLVRDTVRQLMYSYPRELVDLQPGARTLIDTVDGQAMYRVRSLFLGPCGLLSTRLTYEAYFPEGDSLCGSNSVNLDGGEPGIVYTPGIPFRIDTLTYNVSPVFRHFRYMNTTLLECGTAYDFTDVTVPTHNLYIPLVDLKLYPNPASEGFTVEMPGAGGSYELRLYTLSGATVGSYSVKTGKTYVPLPRLTAGVYTAVIVGHDGPVARGRVVIL
ncbi:putative secreted protein (Por secretion system target) [Neolewinella xylanilytica]|uniref:Putative secreted protein (Por secretion system target) n=1 Tax=Neolewinella xylanilytica TaxID=1514080 RepID=A0A2S6IAW2_9BACT|nr:T9SS type A sorting domain-containing protein [Neolewinella xylanilytica]PPK88647.1 putative secreted protein (Por secretion system target) [Neolewinella xylanilytica]